MYSILGRRTSLHHRIIHICQLSGLQQSELKCSIQLHVFCSEIEITILMFRAQQTSHQAMLNHIPALKRQQVMHCEIYFRQITSLHLYIISPRTELPSSYYTVV